MYSEVLQIRLGHCPPFCMFQEILVCGKLDNFCRITQGNIVSFDKTDTGGLRGVSAATYLLFAQNLSFKLSKFSISIS